MTLLDTGLPTAADVWALWARGVADRRSPFRTPSIATVSVDGLPQVRTVVLRSAHQDDRQLVIHSDQRADKVAALARTPTLAWHFWNPRHRLQLRATGRATVATSGPAVDAVWERLSPHQRRTYAAHPSPGSPLDAPGDGLPPMAEAAAGRAHFCVIACTVDEVDVLQLARGGHRRCRLAWSADGWQVGWCVP